MLHVLPFRQDCKPPKLTLGFMVVLSKKVVNKLANANTSAKVLH